MKNFIKKSIISFLDKRGFQRKSENRLPAWTGYFAAAKQAFFPKNEDIASIVFSKDRTMQLEAFLASYFQNVDNYGEIKVLYYPSNEKHSIAYEELKKMYSNYPVEFIRETSFKNQLISSLKSIKSDRILFFVDDMIFSRKVDFNWFSKVNPLEYILTLSRGKDLTYSTVLNKPLKTPTFLSRNSNLFEFSWNEIEEFSDWTYPLGVSGYMFSRLELIAMFEQLNFKAPNSLEASMQAFLPFFINRKGLCLEHVVTPCIHTNLTQTEGYNPILGYFTIEELLVLWQEKKRIDYTEFFNLPAKDAETKKYTFLDR